ncbi:MAG: hypothetical protein ACLUHA_17275 [Bacteroides stercoris]
MMDGILSFGFHSVKSGAAITDARIRTSMSHEDWYFMPISGLSKGKVH